MRRHTNTHIILSCAHTHTHTEPCAHTYTHVGVHVYCSRTHTLTCQIYAQGRSPVVEEQFGDVATVVVARLVLLVQRVVLHQSLQQRQLYEQRRDVSLTHTHTHQ